MNIPVKFQISKKLILLLTGLVLSLGLAGCGGQTVNMKEAVKTSVKLNDSTLAEDIRLASSAILLRMKGFPDGYVKGVSFPDSAAPGLKVIGLDYNGFVMKGVNVLNYEFDGETIELSGLMIFEDGLSRRAGVRFLTHYQIAGTGIHIQHASIIPVYTVQPRVESFVVPFDPTVDQDVISADLTSLYGYAVNNAVPIAQLPAGVGDYDVIMFVMDRSSPTAKTIGRISKTKSIETGFEGATTLIDYNGWQVAVISGEIDPHAGTTLYAKLLHQAGKEAGWYSRFPRMQGLFGLTSRSQ